MYSTCMFCNRSLGANRVVEAFPVGHRLAFDAARGRLWVVCAKCERWNLSPVEERWEAVEALEALFRGTRIRVSSENIGLAKHPEGLEMVRVGRPLRPEFAAWRYGDQFGRRRRRALLVGATGSVVLGGLMIGGVAAGIIGGSVLGPSGSLVNVIVNRRTVARVRAPDGELLELKPPDLRNARLEEGAEGIELVLRKRSTEHRFTGEEAGRVAGVVMSRVNHAGGGRRVVHEAVRRLEELGSPEAVLRAGAREPSRNTFREYVGHPALIPMPLRLAIEMALNEEQERRALEGELWLLERRWAEAEEIAAISDDLLLPESTQAFIEGQRSGEPEK